MQNSPHTQNSWAYVSEEFSGKDRTWARTAVAMMFVLGVAHKAQIQVLRDVAEVSRESGQRCESLYGDPVDWALAQRQEGAHVAAVGVAALRMPRRQHWLGRTWYACLALLFWAFFFPTGYELSQGNPEVPGTVAVVSCAVIAFMLIWGMFLGKYEGPKYLSDLAQDIVEHSVALGAAFIGWLLWQQTSHIYLWQATVPYWVGYFVAVPALMGLWFLRDAGKKPWPVSTVSNAQWRSHFLGLMTAQNFYTAREARGYLRELEADAAHAAVALGKPVELSDLGSAAEVASGFELVDVEAPQRQLEEKRSKLVKDVLYLAIVMVAVPWLVVVHEWSWLVGTVLIALWTGSVWFSWRLFRRQRAVVHGRKWLA